MFPDPMPRVLGVPNHRAIRVRPETLLKENPRLHGRDGGLAGAPARGVTVAQFSKLLYRRFPIGRAYEGAKPYECSGARRVGNPRYSRFGNLRYNGWALESARAGGLLTIKVSAGCANFRSFQIVGIRYSDLVAALPALGNIRVRIASSMSASRDCLQDDPSRRIPAGNATT
jgi:hypothetical protein